ncbi:MAG: 30S ribosomal protein S16 [Zetaproteobacteria bacterium CG_4_10_14_0_2_um_filter_55_20]|nr:MAG: 30S ribosomal protein S16 [Zetaproteobacteria bacterium CG1_02_55_237]PIS19212.1 MAG: 30S ribosomal protein S16 [Zetaproteobacteria bacterium CG08_land_8_20_14_0_20_55_17]PIY51849.1 MAG: 30S ribosomal protein S16 [Zetaproteobacteria bacterium CG_4_10_14_0_8_um_filter_55_43]PIZ39909.1 MAG: 30S ribosomal protein S16 [Zetaproteobacteria bacterium CG_4_10_14_0_2_um_filter_55_20]PJB79806.1 MAG: 30S ribosomal protein S16 [Zetaproteobacteria bacterium CG_4_9_14_0_8_um_filter_55_31]
MATMIRLQRGGRKKRPFYSIVVMDKRDRRDGAFIEKLGYYDPCTTPDVLELNLERVNAWKAEGAEVSGRVASLIRLAENPELAAKASAKAEAAVAAKKAAAEAKIKAEAEAAAKAKADAEAEAKAAEKAAAKAAADEAAAEAAAAEPAVEAAAEPAAEAEEAVAEDKKDV